MPLYIIHSQFKLYKTQPTKSLRIITSTKSTKQIALYLSNQQIKINCSDRCITLYSLKFNGQYYLDHPSSFSPPPLVSLLPLPLTCVAVAINPYPRIIVAAVIPYPPRDCSVSSSYKLVRKKYPPCYTLQRNKGVYSFFLVSSNSTLLSDE
jgi:hypothetical protein